MEWRIIFDLLSIGAAIVSVFFAIKARKYFLRTDKIEELIELKKCEAVVWDAISLIDALVQLKRPETSGKGGYPNEEIPNICVKLNSKINEMKKELSDIDNFPLFKKEKEFDAIEEIITGREELLLSQIELWSATMNESAMWLKGNLNNVKKELAVG